jgi:hypothetical protein
VIQLGQMLGEAMARRVLGNAVSCVVGAIDDLLVAEASAAHTTMVGKTLAELAVSDRYGVHLVGVLERGRFRAATAELPVTSRSVLIMTGDAENTSTPTSPCSCASCARRCRSSPGPTTTGTCRRCTGGRRLGAVVRIVGRHRRLERGR